MTTPDEGADCFFEIFFDADGARLRRVFMTSVAPKFQSRGLRVYDDGYEIFLELPAPPAPFSASELQTWVWVNNMLPALSLGAGLPVEEAPGGLKGARQTAEGDGVIITRGSCRFPESMSAALRCAGYDVLHNLEERDRDCAGFGSSDLIIRVARFVH
jgi:hypothetical protein